MPRRSPLAPTRSRRRPRRSKAGHGLKLAAVVAILVGINLYMFFFKDGTSIPDVRRAAQARLDHPNLLPRDAGTAAGPGVTVAAPSEADGEGRVAKGEVQKNDSLGGILRREGVAAPQADAVLRSLQPLLDFRTIRPGQAYRLVFASDGALTEFELKTSPVDTFRVKRDQTGKMQASKDEAKTQLEVELIGAPIDSSLYATVTTMGESGELVALLADLFAYDINFFVDPQKGDRIEAMVEKHYLDGRFLRYGKILAASYDGAVGHYQAFYFSPTGDDKIAGYYAADGQNVAKSMLKTPLKFSRISSGFNPRRMHPVLHTVRGHFGVDYAAPVGTPVWAAASGKVTFRGWRGGGGNTIIVEHGGGLVTKYMHLSRFHGSVKVGRAVRQKDVIGYVGKTGLATGPHLHFSLVKNGRNVDPLKEKSQPLPPLPKQHMAAFQTAIAERVAALEDGRRGGTLVAAAPGVSVRLPSVAWLQAGLPRREPMLPAQEVEDPPVAQAGLPQGMGIGALWGLARMMSGRYKAWH